VYKISDVLIIWTGIYQKMVNLIIDKSIIWLCQEKDVGYLGKACVDLINIMKKIEGFCLIYIIPRQADKIIRSLHKICG